MSNIHDFEDEFDNIERLNIAAEPKIQKTDSISYYPKDKERADFYFALSTMLHSDLSVSKAVAIYLDETISPYFIANKKAVTEFFSHIQYNIDRGSISEANEKNITVKNIFNIEMVPEEKSCLESLLYCSRKESCRNILEKLSLMLLSKITSLQSTPAKPFSQIKQILKKVD